MPACAALRAMSKIDDKDLKILKMLREDAKLTTYQISKKTLTPVTTVYNRIKKLERLGVIRKYTVEVDEKKLGKNIMAVVLITVNYTLPDGRKVSQIELAKQISRHPYVENLCIVTGGTDIIMTVRVESVEKLNDFIIKELRDMDGIDKTQTMIVLSSF